MGGKKRKKCGQGEAQCGRCYKCLPIERFGVNPETGKPYSKCPNCRTLNEVASRWALASQRMHWEGPWDALGLPRAVVPDLTCPIRRVATCSGDEQETDSTSPPRSASTGG